MPETSLNELLSQTSARLKKINQETGTRFDQCVPILAGQLDEQALIEFCQLTLAIADAGWRSYECVNLLIDLAAQIDDGARLLEIARYGEQFSGYSFEPSLRYFRFLLEVSIRSDEVREIERGALALQNRYTHAASLLTGYFESATVVVAAPSVTSWVALSGRLLEADRDALVRFLKISRTVVGVDWLFVDKLGQQSLDACLAYLDWFPRLQGAFSQSELSLLGELFIKHARDDGEALLAAMMGLMPLSFEAKRLMIELGGLIEPTDVLVQWLAADLSLPLDRPDVVRAWLAEGLVTQTDSAKGLLAWVSLESLNSINMLAELKGQVAFSDHARTFNLLAEALSASKIDILIADEPPESHRSSALQAGAIPQHVMPEIDGRTVLMPAVVNLFETAEDNFGFYKLSLFHQLGYAEFGLFRQATRVNEALSGFEDRLLAETLFMILEDGRIDWQLCARYPGLAAQARIQKHRAASQRTAQPVTWRGRLLEALVLLSLDVESKDERLIDLVTTAEELLATIAPLKAADATVQDSLSIAATLYGLIAAQNSSSSPRASGAQLMLMAEELPEPIAYRGEIDVGTVESTLRIDALVEEWQEQLEAPTEDNATLSSGANQDQVDIGDLQKGDVSSGVAMIIEELEQELGLESGTLDPEAPGIPATFPGGISSAERDASRHVYDEWDYEIGDYRSRWCTLFEHREMELDDDYVQKTLREHSELSKRIRQQLNRVRPEMLRKVKGVVEGEELDLERSIAYLVDRKAGLLPDDNIYIQRQRKDRDVSTLFLLDMSASTDDIVPDPLVPPLEYPEVDDDEFLVEFFREQKEREDHARKIIDLEKESVLLMADALETLGDAYSVCGFSGYGRDQVDYYLCKDFNEPFDQRSRSRIGGIKPCRSTRMGPAIRHGTRRLIETGSRIKAMIIISDGYPQDHDYGTDRNSRDYGLMDTMKALTEAKQQGVLTYCLTVDPSGHDYLRAMCPDSQYMVIQDIVQLPHEVSRVYRSLTG